jgi:hypothetical protein
MPGGRCPAGRGVWASGHAERASQGTGTRPESYPTPCTLRLGHAAFILHSLSRSTAHAHSLTHTHPHTPTHTPTHTHTHTHTSSTACRIQACGAQEPHPLPCPQCAHSPACFGPHSRSPSMRSTSYTCTCCAPTGSRQRQQRRWSRRLSGGGGRSGSGRRHEQRSSRGSGEVGR